jgi:hypothetical protein
VIAAHFARGGEGANLADPLETHIFLSAKTLASKTLASKTLASKTLASKTLASKTFVC